MKPTNCTTMMSGPGVVSATVSLEQSGRSALITSRMKYPSTLGFITLAVLVGCNSASIPGIAPVGGKVSYVDKVEYAAAGASSMEAASTGNAAEERAKRALPKKYAEAASTLLAIEVPANGKRFNLQPSSQLSAFLH